MKRQFTSILLFSALLVGGASTFVSCKDYESDSAYETSTTVAKQLKDYEDKLGDVNRDLQNFKDTYKKCECTDQHVIDMITQRIKANNETLKEYLGLSDYLKTNDLNDKIKDYLDANEAYQSALKASQAYGTIINNLYKQGGMSDSLKIAYDKAQENWTAIYGEGGINSKISGITTEVGNLQTDLEYVKALAKEDSTRIDTLSSNLRTLINQAKQEVINMIPTDEHINGLIDTKLAEYYTKTEIDTKISGIQDQIDNLKNSVNDLLNKQVSEIIVQASECPVTGYENTPFGAQVNILGAYYGNAVNGFTDYKGNRINQNETFIAPGNDNAGTIYVTINPGNVNPDAIALRLVDSQGNAIASTNPNEGTPYLLEWANTDRVLKFGVSRAVEARSNGFYAVHVKLNPASVNDAKIWNSTDKENLKAVGKNILEKLKHPKSTNLQLANIASTINSTFNNRLTAYGVEASWTQRDTNGNIVNKKVTSKLGLAAVSINPLSFNFLSDGINVDLPQIPSLEAKLDLKSLKFNYDPIDINTIEDVTITVPNGKNVKVVEKNGMQAVTITKDENGVVSDVTFNASNITVQGEDLIINVSMDEFRSVVNNLNSQMGNMIANVNDYIKKVNGWAETIDGNYINRINNFIKRFENLLTKANSLLQPAMFYTTSTGNWNQLARVESGASHLKLNGGQATTVFIASSYTAELLAPAYQKELTVNGGATLTAGGKSGSTVVLDGNKYKVGFKATKAGVYTITYKARDYSGNEVSKKFFVKVVD